jgi:hypothetical protein
LERRPGDPIEETVKLGSQAITQARSLILIPEQGFPNIDPRLRPEEKA